MLLWNFYIPGRILGPKCFLFRHSNFFWKSITWKILSPELSTQQGYPSSLVTLLPVGYVWFLPDARPLRHVLIPVTTVPWHTGYFSLELLQYEMLNISHYVISEPLSLNCFCLLLKCFLPGDEKKRKPVTFVKPN